MIQQFNRSNQKGENRSKTFRIINDLKELRKRAEINFTKDLHQQYL